MEYLLTQPPKALKFYPVRKDAFNARGAIVVMDKSTGFAPDLHFYRYDFFLSVKNNKEIKKAYFFIDKLTNYHIEATGEELLWSEEREAVSDMMDDYLENDGKFYVGEHEKALCSWQEEVKYGFDAIESEVDLKKNFSWLMDGVFVVRHYFETEWVILTGDNPIKINFKDVYKNHG